MMQAVLLVQAGATLFLTGAIWYVQGVHYPLMARVEEEFGLYHRLHSRRTTWVVFLPMLVEAAAALLLVLRPHPALPPWSTWAGLFLVALIWMSTACLQVPQHRRLAAGFDAPAHRRLVRTNWVRTAAWSLRGGLALWMLQAA